MTRNSTNRSRLLGPIIMIIVMLVLVAGHGLMVKNEMEESSQPQLSPLASTSAPDNVALKAVSTTQNIAKEQPHPVDTAPVLTSTQAAPSPATAAEVVAKPITDPTPAAASASSASHDSEIL